MEITDKQLADCLRENRLTQYRRTKYAVERIVRSDIDSEIPSLESMSAEDFRTLAMVYRQRLIEAVQAVNESNMDKE